MEDALSLRLQAIVQESPLLSPILRNWEKIALPDCWLVAGAVAQTVWNHSFGLPLTHGINDVDIVYFDAGDLSEGAEAEHALRIRSSFSDLPVWIDVKNEARVHLWYEEKFKYPIAPYTSAADAITTFPTTATAVGVQPGTNGLELCAPYGISDLLKLVVRPIKKQITRDIYKNKIDRWVVSWPGLKIIGWDE
ncbi:nucleotidyltransferase family protein [Rhizobium sp. RCC_161_2]|uniref:nucleotidyltransferase family protein n=1 Tax=Rhizobium sp. RCC_161_2 TaxID=3239219 RepID=UPI003523F2E9